MPFTYTYSNPGINTVLSSVSYSGSDSTVAVIPATVTSIGNTAFSNPSVNPVLTAVDCSLAPLVSFGELVFGSCALLTSINIPNTVTSIGIYTFSGCGFTTFSWPTNISLIDLGMFNSCAPLTSIYIPNTVTSIGWASFAATGFTTFSWPSAVTTIADTMFASCTSLTSIYIPNTVTFIDYNAFEGCGFTTFSWPSAVTSISEATFLGCSLLTSINIPNSVTTIAAYVFYFCGFTTFSWPSSVAIIDVNTFSACNSLTSVNIPNTVSTIQSYAFYSCNSLTQIKIQKMTTPLTTLSSNSFGLNNGITSTYPNYTCLIGMLLQGYTTTDLTTAGFNAAAITAASDNNKFTYTYSDSNTKTVINSVTYLGSGSTTATPLFSVTSIGANAFSTSSVTSTLTSADFILATSLIDIGDSAFNNCTVLTNVATIPNTVKSIGTNSFYNCTALTNISTIPNTVTSIGIAAFSRCGFRYLSWWPTGTTLIDDSTFSYCSNLTYINIPSTVNSIDTLAFDNCTSLTNIILPFYTKPTKIPLASQSFSNTTAITGANYNTLTRMIQDGGYTTGELTTAGFNATAISNAAAASCFNEGTKILCFKNDKEEYIPIQDLRKRDVVKTYLHGYKKIDLIGKAHLRNNSSNKWKNNMFVMHKTPENNLIEDLIMTGGHSILVDELSREVFREDRIGYYEIQKNNSWMIDGKHLLLAGVSKFFKEIQDDKLYTYYNFTLDSDGDDEKRYGIWANGVLAEIPSKTQFVSFNEYEIL